MSQANGNACKSPRGQAIKRKQIVEFKFFLSISRKNERNIIIKCTNNTT